MSPAPPGNEIRVLAVALRSRGFGFAVIEGQTHLVDWGTRTARAAKASRTLAGIRALLAHYRPDRLVLEDHRAPGSRRHPRIRTLLERVRRLADDEAVRSRAISRAKVQRAFAPIGARTRYEIAVAIARLFPEIEDRLPPYREAYMSEDDRLSIFDAVSFALAHSLRFRHVPGAMAEPSLA